MLHLTFAQELLARHGTPDRVVHIMKNTLATSAHKNLLPWGCGGLLRETEGTAQNGLRADRNLQSTKLAHDFWGWPANFPAMLKNMWEIMENTPTLA